MSQVAWGFFSSKIFAKSEQERKVRRECGWYCQEMHCCSVRPGLGILLELLDTSTVHRLTVLSFTCSRQPEDQMPPLLSGRCCLGPGLGLGSWDQGAPCLASRAFVPVTNQTTSPGPKK